MKVDMEIRNPPMTFADDEAAKSWEECVKNNSEDIYSFACVRYAATIAWLAESLMRDAKIDQASPDAVREWIKVNMNQVTHDADSEGVTGFMYGSAINILSHCWIHGNLLRSWHNKEWGGTGEEEGTINPAIMTIKE